FTAATFALGALTHLSFFTGLGQGLVAALAALWLLVAARTAYGARHGGMFLPPPLSVGSKAGLPRR
ncbi:MAG: TDT family transporter, partial [Deinococcus sp.]